MTSTIGIPIKLLNEAQACRLTKATIKTSKLTCLAQNHVVTLEITSGQVYRGKLIEGILSPFTINLRISVSSTCKQRLIGITGIYTAEDNMNVQLKDITVTARDGRVSHLDQVYIRGSHVRFFIVPDMLRFVNQMVLQRNQVEL